MLAILKHELKMAFNSLTIYLFYAALLCFVGVGAMNYNIQASVANFEYVLSYVSVVLVVIIPILTMKVFSEERKQKTDQLLYSLPLNTTQIVMGKYISLVLLFLVPILIICIYPLIFAQFGDVYLPTSYGTIFAFFLMGCALIAMGMFISSLTDNQGFAAGIAIVVFLFNYFSVTLAKQVSSTSLQGFLAICVIVIIVAIIINFVTKNSFIAVGVGSTLLAINLVVYVLHASYFESLLPDIMEKLSLFDRFSNFVSGVFDLTAIVFYLSIIILGIFLTVQSLEKRRYN